VIYAKPPAWLNESEKNKYIFKVEDTFLRDFFVYSYPSANGDERE